MVDLLWATIGFTVGALVVGILFEVNARRREGAHPPTRVGMGWRLTEFTQPAIMARDLLDVRLPPGTRVLASGIVDPHIVKTCDVRHVPPVRAEFAIDGERQRAILFTAGAQEGTVAVQTVDPTVVARLATEFQQAWDNAAAYVERHSIAQLAGRAGVVVETKGTVQDVLPFKQDYMLRLEDQGHIIGVLVRRDLDAPSLRDERVIVKGRLERDETGYAVIRADEVNRTR